LAAYSIFEGKNYNTVPTPTEPSTHGGNQEGAPKGRSLRIIVADDDRDTVLTLMMVLRDEGHEVRGFYRGSDVARAVNEFNPDAAIVDFNMPDMNGFDVAKQVQNRRGRRPLLIAISGVYKKDFDKVRARMVGFNHYLTKPYEPSDVLVLLKPLRTLNAP
jgi:DNA-binding response OmpR family regulator